MNKLPLTLCAGILLGASSLAHATLHGMSSQPYGGKWSRGDAGSAYAVWDHFSNANWPTGQSSLPAGYGLITNNAPGDFFGLTDGYLNQIHDMQGGTANQGVGMYDYLTGASGDAGTDLIYTGANTVSFTISGTVSFDIRGISLQIKRLSGTGTLADANGFAPLLSINGGVGIAYDGTTLVSGTDATNVGNGQWSVTTYYWDASLANLVYGEGPNTFSLSFGNTNMRRAFDTFAVDVGSVPEPTTGLLAGLGVGLTLLRRKRRN